LCGDTGERKRAAAVVDRGLAVAARTSDICEVGERTGAGGACRAGGAWWAVWAGWDLDFDDLRRAALCGDGHVVTSFRTWMRPWIQVAVRWPSLNCTS